MSKPGRGNKASIRSEAPTLSISAGIVPPVEEWKSAPTAFIGGGIF